MCPSARTKTRVNQRHLKIVKAADCKIPPNWQENALSHIESIWKRDPIQREGPSRRYASMTAAAPMKRGMKARTDLNTFCLRFEMVWKPFGFSARTVGGVPLLDPWQSPQRLIRPRCVPWTLCWTNFLRWKMNDVRRSHKFSKFRKLRKLRPKPWYDFNMFLNILINVYKII